MTDDLTKILASFKTDIVPTSVGRATIAWNNVCYAVFSLYSTLSGLEPETAKATFFCVASDRSQRDMASALVEKELKPRDPERAKKAKSLIDSINKIAAKRNDILHIVFIDEQSPETVKPFNPRGHIKDKTGDELIGAIHALTMDCLDTAVAIMKLTTEIQKSSHARMAIVQALLQSTPRLESEETGKQPKYGLLDFPPKTPPSPGSDQTG